jgi:hypothetical protein
MCRLAGPAGISHLSLRLPACPAHDWRIPVIRFYFHPTPNPAKVALMLEELGLAYEVIPVDTSKGEQHAPGYRAMGDAVDLNLFD